MRHKEQRVLVLFDVQNLYYSAKHLYNTKVNFKTILEEAVAKRKLIRAIAYVIKTEIKEEANFHDALNKMGIEVKQKDLQVFYGGAKKGDWDIGIAMDAVRMVSKIDNLVLVSGDGDFKDLLAYMKSHGVRCEVMALGKTASKHLKEEADLFIDIEHNINKYLIGKKPQRKPQKKVVVHEKKEFDAPKIATNKNNGFVMPDVKKGETEKNKNAAVKKTAQKKHTKTKASTKRKEKSKDSEKKEEPKKDNEKKGIASKLKGLLGK